MSDRTPSSPTRRSTSLPSTVACPSTSSPSATKNAVAAARSSTTMAMLSIRWIVPRPGLKPRWSVSSMTVPLLVGRRIRRRRCVVSANGRGAIVAVVWLAAAVWWQWRTSCDHGGMGPERADLAAVYESYLACCNEHRFDQLGEFVDERVRGSRAVDGLAAYI